MSGARADRRQFLTSVAAAGAAASLFPSPLLSQGAAPRVVVIGGGFGGASCARALRQADPRIAVTLVEANAVYTAPPMSSAAIAGLYPLKHQQFGYDDDQARRRHRCAVGRDRHRSADALGDARRRLEARLRPAGAVARHRFPLGRHPRLRPRRRAGHAACLERRRAGRAAAPPARGHGRRRHGGDLVAGQSGALPAGALRAREPDRALPQDQEAALEGDRARRQGRLHHAEAVRGGLEGALSRPDRMGVAVERRRAVLGRGRDAARWSPTSTSTRPRSPTSSRRRRPDMSPSSPASPIAPAGVRSIR